MTIKPTPKPRLCACQNYLEIKIVQTANGSVSLGMCPECDRMRCPSCRKAIGPYFPNRDTRLRCDDCDRPV